MNLALGVVIAASCWPALRRLWRANRSAAPRRAPRRPRGCSRRSHAATATLPHLRRGLNMRSAAHAVPHLRALTGAAAIALADTQLGAGDRGRGARAGPSRRPAVRLLAATPDDRMHIVPRLVSSDPTCPLRAAVLAPLHRPGPPRRDADHLLPRRGPPRPGRAARRRRGGQPRRRPRSSCRPCPSRRSDWPRPSCGRCARRSPPTSSTTRWPRSPATSMPARRDAREQLIDFAEFTRYLFRDGRSYVTARRGTGPRRALPAAGAGPLSRTRCTSRVAVARGVPRRRRARAVGAAAGGERRPPRRPGATGAAGGRSRSTPRVAGRTWSCGSATTARGSIRTRSPRLLAGTERRDRAGQRRRPAARHLRRAVRAADRIRAGAGYDGDHDRAQPRR